MRMLSQVHVDACCARGMLPARHVARIDATACRMKAWEKAVFLFFFLNLKKMKNGILSNEKYHTNPYKKCMNLHGNAARNLLVTLSSEPYSACLHGKKMYQECMANSACQLPIR